MSVIVCEALNANGWSGLKRTRETEDVSDDALIEDLKSVWKGIRRLLV